MYLYRYIIINYIYVLLLRSLKSRYPLFRESEKSGYFFGFPSFVRASFLFYTVLRYTFFVLFYYFPRFALASFLFCAVLRYVFLMIFFIFPAVHPWFNCLHKRKKEHLRLQMFFNHVHYSICPPIPPGSGVGRTVPRRVLGCYACILMPYYILSAQLVSFYASQQY